MGWLEEDFRDTIDELGEWARSVFANTKGVSDIDVTVSPNDSPHDVRGEVLINSHDNNKVHMKGFLHTPTLARDPNTGKKTRDDGDYWLVDFNVVWSPQLSDYSQFQTTNDDIDGIRARAAMRRQARAGVMPEDYHQSINRKKMLTEYYGDGGVVFGE